MFHQTTIKINIKFGGVPDKSRAKLLETCVDVNIRMRASVETVTPADRLCSAGSWTCRAGFITRLTGIAGCRQECSALPMEWPCRLATISVSQIFGKPIKLIISLLPTLKDGIGVAC